MKSRKNKNKTIGFGYVGQWIDGTLGWSMPEFVSGSGKGTKTDRKYADKPRNEGRPWAADEPHYLCKITVELIKDKRGRPIVRYPVTSKKETN